MKKTLITLSLVVATTAAFAQGKVNLANDVNSPITLDIAAKVMAADAGVAGAAVATTGPLPSGISLKVGLYSISGTTYTLQGSTVINPTGGTGYDAGTISPTKIVLTGVPGGTAANFQVKIWDNAFASPELSTTYYGENTVFSMVPGMSIAYPNTYNGGSTTWKAGPIVVSVVPEPSTMALAGLGAAALLIFRRRK